jgi:hypothetical protein
MKKTHKVTCRLRGGAAESWRITPHGGILAGTPTICGFILIEACSISRVVSQSAHAYNCFWDGGGRTIAGVYYYSY